MRSQNNENEENSVARSDQRVSLSLRSVRGTSIPHAPTSDTQTKLPSLSADPARSTRSPREADANATSTGFAAVEVDQRHRRRAGRSTNGVEGGVEQMGTGTVQEIRPRNGDQGTWTCLFANFLLTPQLQRWTLLIHPSHVLQPPLAVNILFRVLSVRILLWMNLFVG